MDVCPYYLITYSKNNMIGFFLFISALSIFRSFPSIVMLAQQSRTRDFGGGREQTLSGLELGDDYFESIGP